MPTTVHILDPRSHKSRHSEGNGSVTSSAGLSLTSPASNGTTVVDLEQDAAEHRIQDAEDQVSTSELRAFFIIN